MQHPVLARWFGGVAFVLVGVSSAMGQPSLLRDDFGDDAKSACCPA
jgi:hypothetical protein